MAKKKKQKHAEIAAPVEVDSVAASRGLAWWVQGLVVFGVIYCAGLGLRLVELPYWLAGDFRVQGQWIMATHDAYHFLAGAIGLSGGGALPGLASMLSGLTGASLENLAFWLPVIFAPLAALPVCLVTTRWGMPEAGIIAGLMTVTAPGFWQRTRLGFFDDDMLIIPALLVLIAGFVLLLQPYCRERWFSRDEGKEVGLRDWAKLLTGGLVLGLWAKCCVWIYHQSFTVVLAVVATGIVLGVILARQGTRLALGVAFTVALTAWFAGPFTVLVVLLGLVGLLFGFQQARRRHWPVTVIDWKISLPVSVVLLLLVAVLFRGEWLPRVSWMWGAIQTYYLAVATEDTLQASLLGGVAEVVRLPAWAVSYLLAGHWSLMILGGVGFCWLLWKRPLAAMFLPLGGIALASYFLGARFTVFSAAFFGLGLGCGLAFLLRLFPLGAGVRWAAVVASLPLLFLFVSKPVTHFRPDPVMSSRQVHALKEIREMAGEQARVWNWWDLGHATLFFTERAVVERASNGLVYARAMALDAPEDLVNRIGGRSEQYVVVSWEKLGGVENMLAQGTFDISTGQSTRQGQIQRLTGTFEFDLDQGFLIAPGGRIPLRILDIIEQDGPQRFVWPWQGQGNHAVLNRIERTGYLMDATVSETMYVRMLLGPVAEMEPEFELVVDDWPWVRVFSVSQ